jgi:hypothetical protein
MACYGYDADLPDQCGKIDPETGRHCQLPADAPEFYDEDGTEEYHEYAATFTDP